MLHSFALISTLLLTVAPQAPATAPTEGILLLAHGGGPEWNARVTTLAASLGASTPVEVAFGMATRANIQGAIDRLQARGVSSIVAVPLFVSSHSSVITSTEYLLGLRAERPRDLEIFARMSHGAGGGHEAHAPAADPEANLRPVQTTLPIVMAPALNDHPLVADILGSRALALSRAPASEAVVIVAHGPVPDVDNARWLADMRRLADRIGASTPFASIDALTVRDDAPAPIRDRATAELRSLVERRAGEGRRVLIVPLLLTYGGIERGIVKRLEGLTYEMASQALLPDPRIEEWVRASVAAARTPAGAQR
ncbi:MAG TPA: CbiX/SirB N-terminal domain-containing protein [Vicinamibacterales bacterium]|nr:CbiX/SirB N-terminal domain-containing protein [Vicinamibacterales bacterium]